jgi:Beta-lactamase superfamily domain
MKVEYICHACLLIDTGDTRIVTDPWLNGSAYADQWFVFPKPVDTDRARQADVILLSHGHEDHMHGPTLESLPKSARIFFPYNWWGNRPYLEYLGFKRIQEAVTGKRYKLGPDTFVTYVANNLDSIMVVESGGRVLVDVNDALHAHHPRVIELFTEQIRRRWPRVDMVFCGFGGASYFPNTIHVEGKNDEAVGRLREQFFIHNFCRIVAALKPRVAVPFAADFALLEPNNEWMNRIRFPRTKIADYFREQFGAESPETVIHAMFPGDALDGETLQPNSVYRAELHDGDLHHLIARQYPQEIEAAGNPATISEESAAKLADEIRQNVGLRSKLFRSDLLANLRFAIRATDVAENAFYHVRFADGAAQVERSAEPKADELLVIGVSSRILRYSFSSTWGGDAITIGYGCDIRILDKRALPRKLDTVCVRLLTRHPSASREMMKRPVRATRFLLSNPLTRKWAIRRLRHRDNLDATYDPELWLARTKCEVCQVCDMPMLDSRFSATL